MDHAHYYASASSSWVLNFAEGKIKLLDYSNMDLTTLLDTSKGSNACEGIPNTDYIFNVEKDDHMVKLYDINDSSLYKTMPLTNGGAKIKHATWVQASSYIITYHEDGSDNGTTSFNYKDPENSYITFDFGLLFKSSALGSMNIYNNFLLGHESPFFQIKTIWSNQKIWSRNDSTGKPNIIRVADDDSHIVYVTDDDEIVVLQKDDFNFDPACSEDKHVYTDTKRCLACDTIVRYTARKDFCTGLFGNAQSRFFNFDIQNLNEDSISPTTGKRRYKFKFEAVDWNYLGPGGGMANYDIAANLNVSVTNGKTISIVDVTQNNVTNSAEFYIVFQTELSTNEAFDITFGLTSKIIDDGLDDDMIQLNFVDKSVTTTFSYTHCDFFSQVKQNGTCIDCLSPAQYQSNPAACRG